VNALVHWHKLDSGLHRLPAVVEDPDIHRHIAAVVPGFLVDAPVERIVFIDKTRGIAVVRVIGFGQPVPCIPDQV
jgi:hypothetical protein